MPHQTCAKFHRFWGEDQKKQKKTLSKNLRKNGSCSQILKWWSVFWGSRTLNCTPVTPRQLLYWGTILTWGAQFSFGGAQAVISGARPRNAPTWRRAWLDNADWFADTAISQFVGLILRSSTAEFQKKKWCCYFKVRFKVCMYGLKYLTWLRKRERRKTASLDHSQIAPLMVIKVGYWIHIVIWRPCFLNL